MSLPKIKWGVGGPNLAGGLTTPHFLFVEDKIVPLLWGGEKLLGGNQRGVIIVEPTPSFIKGFL